MLQGTNYFRSSHPKAPSLRWVPSGARQKKRHCGSYHTVTVISIRRKEYPRCKNSRGWKGLRLLIAQKIPQEGNKSRI